MFPWKFLLSFEDMYCDGFKYLKPESIVKCYNSCLNSNFDETNRKQNMYTWNTILVFLLQRRGEFCHNATHSLFTLVYLKHKIQHGDVWWPKKIHVLANFVVKWNFWLSTYTYSGIVFLYYIKIFFFWSSFRTKQWLLICEKIWNSVFLSFLNFRFFVLLLTRVIEQNVNHFLQL